MGITPRGHKPPQRSEHVPNKGKTRTKPSPLYYANSADVIMITVLIVASCVPGLRQGEHALGKHPEPSGLFL